MIQSIEHKQNKCYTVSTTITWLHQFSSTEMVLIQDILNEIKACSTQEELRLLRNAARHSYVPQYDD